jgi:hypothetical protein
LETIINLLNRKSLLLILNLILNMGNCTGVFGSCVGEDQNAIKKIDKDNMKKALAANQEMQASADKVNDQN